MTCGAEAQDQKHTREDSQNIHRCSLPKLAPATVGRDIYRSDARTSDNNNADTIYQSGAAMSARIANSRPVCPFESRDGGSVGNADGGRARPDLPAQNRNAPVPLSPGSVSGATIVSNRESTITPSSVRVTRQASIAGAVPITRNARPPGFSHCSKRGS